MADTHLRHTLATHTHTQKKEEEKKTIRFECITSHVPAAFHTSHVVMEIIFTLSPLSHFLIFLKEIIPLTSLWLWTIKNKWDWLEAAGGGDFNKMPGHE